MVGCAVSGAFVNELETSASVEFSGTALGEVAAATGTQRAALQPRLARQRPRLFAVNAAAEAGPAWELLFSRECRIDQPMRAGAQFLPGNSESSLLARPGPLDADRDWDATS